MKTADAAHGDAPRRADAQWRKRLSAEAFRRVLLVVAMLGLPLALCAWPERRVAIGMRWILRGERARVPPYSEWYPLIIGLRKSTWSREELVHGVGASMGRVYTLRGADYYRHRHPNPAEYVLWRRSLLTDPPVLDPSKIINERRGR